MHISLEGWKDLKYLWFIVILRFKGESSGGKTMYGAWGGEDVSLWWWTQVCRVTAAEQNEPDEIQHQVYLGWLGVDCYLDSFMFYILVQEVMLPLAEYVLVTFLCYSSLTKAILFGLTIPEGYSPSWWGRQRQVRVESWLVTLHSKYWGAEWEQEVGSGYKASRSAPATHFLRWSSTS